jgi:hypothetical protein
MTGQMFPHVNRAKALSGSLLLESLGAAFQIVGVSVVYPKGALRCGKCQEEGP